MKSTTKKIITYTIISFLIVGVLGFVVYSSYNYYLFVNIDGKIVEDNSRLEKICESKFLCEVVTGVTWPCEQGEYKYTEERLYSWSGFKGCNNLTKGYGEDGYITGIKSCSCRNIIG